MNENSDDLCKGLNMVGAPEETYALYQDTVRLNREVHPDSFQITIFYPYPGTELFAAAKREGVILDRFSDDFVSESILKMKRFPRWKIKYARRMFYYHVFRHQKTALHKLYYIIKSYTPAGLMPLLRVFDTALVKLFSRGSVRDAR